MDWQGPEKGSIPLHFPGLISNFGELCLSGPNSRNLSGNGGKSIGFGSKWSVFEAWPSHPLPMWFSSHIPIYNMGQGLEALRNPNSTLTKLLSVQKEMCHVPHIVCPALLLYGHAAIVLDCKCLGVWGMVKQPWLNRKDTKLSKSRRLFLAVCSLSVRFPHGFLCSWRHLNSNRGF